MIRNEVATRRGADEVAASQQLRRQAQEYIVPSDSSMLIRNLESRINILEDRIEQLFDLLYGQQVPQFTIKQA